MNGILGERSSGWHCFFMKHLGLMPCDECSCFDSATLSCNKDGHVITHEVLNILRDAYGIQDEIKIEVTDDDPH